MYFLEDDIVGLRNLSIEDADGNYKDWFNDAVACQFNSHHRFPMTLSSIKTYIDTCNNSSAIVLAVDIKEWKRHIGNISLQQIDLINRQAELAVMFGEKDCWGHGYVTRAAKLVIRHGFYELGLNRIYFGTPEDCIGMQKIGDKLGFKKIGIKREAFFKSGVYKNIFDYDLLVNDWEQTEGKQGDFE